MTLTREITASTGALARRGVSTVLDALFPPLCVCCRARVSQPHSLCAACWSAISFIEEPFCVSCGTPFDIDPGGETVCGPCLAKPHDFARARALFRYDDASKPLVLTFKYGDRLDHAPAFARWLERTGRALLEETDLIVPVPLHRWRLWKRRYNQASILAARLARLSAPSIRWLLRGSAPPRTKGKCPPQRRGGAMCWGPFASRQRRQEPSKAATYCWLTTCLPPAQPWMPAPGL